MTRVVSRLLILVLSTTLLLWHLMPTIPLHLCMWDTSELVAHGSSVLMRMPGAGSTDLMRLCSVLMFLFENVEMTHVLGTSVLTCLCVVLLTWLVPPNVMTAGTALMLLTLDSMLPMVLTRENGLGRELLIMRMTRLVLVILLNADPNVLTSRAGRWCMKLMALIHVHSCLLPVPVWCMVALKAVNSVPLISLVELASWPANDDPLVPAQLIMVMAGRLK